MQSVPCVPGTTKIMTGHFLGLNLSAVAAWDQRAGPLGNRRGKCQETAKQCSVERWEGHPQQSSVAFLLLFHY